MSYLSEDADPARFPFPRTIAMKILIGPENVADALKDTSVVVASYDIGDGMRGVIGVVGPTRVGLRQDNRPPVLSGRGPLPAVWTG